MPFHQLAIPPANRAFGSPDPANDMNAVLNALGSRFGNEFHINDYGADPTGTLLSDTAWNLCYADATASLQVNSGALIMLGGGQYKFSVNTVNISDARIGLMGQGRVATTLFTTGSSGNLMTVAGANAGSQGCAPISGFNLYGWNAGAATTGLRYGDRLNGYLECSASGFNGAGSRGFWVLDNAGTNSEGSFFILASDNNTVCYDFDAVTPASGASLDYSHLYLHVGITTLNGVNSVGMRVINGMHLYGGYVQLSGNIRASSSLTATVLQVGGSGTDTSHISDSYLNVAVEADAGTGTNNDLLIQGVDAFKGIVKCHGQITIPPFGGTVTAGSITSPAIVTMWGNFNAPIFSSHGTLTSLGSAAAGLSTYSG